MHVIVHDMNKCRNLHKSLVIDHQPQLFWSISLQNQGCRRTQLKWFSSIPDTQILTNKPVSAILFIFSLRSRPFWTKDEKLELISSVIVGLCCSSIIDDFSPFYNSSNKCIFHTLLHKLSPWSTPNCKHRLLPATFNHRGLKDCRKNTLIIYIRCLWNLKWKI